MTETSISEVLVVQGIRFENVETSEEILPRFEIQGEFHDLKKISRGITSVKVAKVDGIVNIKFTSSTGVDEFPLVAGLGVTSIAWGKNAVAIMIRRFYSLGSSPHCIAIVSIKDGKINMSYIQAVSKNRQIVICDIVEIKDNAIRIEAAVGTDEYRYIFGDLKVNAIPHTDTLPGPDRGQ